MLTTSFSYISRQSEEIDNNDFCRVCNGSGQLLCCDGCVDSFHFSCLDPPVNPDSPPEGQWFCPSCSVRGPFRVLIGEMEQTKQTLFALPEPLRNRYEGVSADEAGRYREVIEPRAGTTRTVYVSSFFALGFHVTFSYFRLLVLEYSLHLFVHLVSLVTNILFRE